MIKCAVVEGDAGDRSRIRTTLENDPRFASVAVFRTGEELLLRGGLQAFDVVALNVSLPGRSGPETVDEFLSYVSLPSVLYYHRSEAQKVQSEMSGATDVLELGRLGQYEEGAFERLADRLVLMSQVKVIRRKRASVERRLHLPSKKILALGASSGAPSTVEAILKRIVTRKLLCLIVQHLPPRGALPFARWLEQVSGWPVKVAESGEPLMEGRVYIAPYGQHLEIGHFTMALTDSEPEAGHCPSASRLFRSLSHHHAKNCVGVVLSGMGRDGAQGLLELRRAGGHTIVESTATAAVSSMPGAACELGAALEVQTTRELPARIAELFPTSGRSRLS